MSVRQLVITASLTLAVLFATASAFAHQQKTAITKVLFNPRTENLEVMHRFYMHDAEHAVKELFDKDADVLSEKTQQAFADYVTKRFAIADQKGNPIALKLLGFEVDGKFLWVYQETAQPTGLQALNVEHLALREIWPSQINTVNVEGKGDLKTLTFDGNTTLLTVEFKGDHSHH